MKADTHPGLDGVVLVRLLVRPKSFSTSALGKDLQSLMGLDNELARNNAEAALARLKERGFIWADTKLQLTEDGEAAALAELGYSSLPTRQPMKWRHARKVLIGKGLGLPPQSALDKAGKSPILAARIVAQKYGLALPKKQEPTPTAVLRALARRAMGLPDGGPLDPSAVLGALLGFLPPPVTSDASETSARPPPQEQSPREKPARAASTKPSTKDGLAAFAHEVNELALSAKEGRWLGHKVFISQVWEDFSRRRPGGDLSIEQFKHRLTEAARASLVLLSRADLMDAYPQEDVHQSQVDVGGRLYHFIETQHLA